MEQLRILADLAADERQQLFEYIASAGCGEPFHSVDEMIRRYSGPEYDCGRLHFSLWCSASAGGRQEVRGCVAAITREAEPKGLLYLIGLQLAAGDFGMLPKLLDAALSKVEETPWRKVFLGMPGGRSDLGTAVQQAGFTFVWKGLALERPVLSSSPETPRLALKTLRFRPVPESAISTLVDVNNAAFRDVANSATLTIEDGLQWYRGRFGTDLIQLGYEDDEPVSLLCLDVQDGIGEVESVGVVPSRQGRGYGQETLSQAVEIFLARGDVKTVRLTVIDSNERALRLYLKNGFAVVRELSAWYQRER